MMAVMNAASYTCLAVDVTPSPSMRVCKVTLYCF